MSPAAALNTPWCTLCPPSNATYPTLTWKGEGTVVCSQEFCDETESERQLLCLQE